MLSNLFEDFQIKFKTHIVSLIFLYYICSMENNDLQISKKELIDISYREVEIKEKLKNISLENKKHKNEEIKTSIEKIKTIQGLLESCIIDEDRQIPGCEIALKNTVTEAEIYTLKDKLFEILKRL